MGTDFFLKYIVLVFHHFCSCHRYHNFFVVFFFRMYPPGGFLNYLQNNKISPFSQTHPFVNYHNASKLPENFHFVGAPISYSTMSHTIPCSKAIPSPTGRCAAAQIGSQDKETIDIEDDDTI